MPLVDLESLRNAQRHPIPYVVPHWQQALDAKFDALKMLQQLDSTKKTSKTLASTLAALSFDDDLVFLQRAETYSFNGETIAAIRAAAATIPRETPLSAITAPNASAGWFWFAEPLPLRSSDASDYINALLWSYAKDGKSIVFSVYVRDEHNDGGTRGRMIPSTRWTWPLSASFAELTENSRVAWREFYGPSGSYRGNVSEENTLKIISELGLFFAMSCVWFSQRVPVLTSELGSVERHARRRYVREHQLSEEPTVRVVALRRSQVQASEPRDGESESSREYTCRWIVKGHTRLQACGPGRADRKLIWVEAHPAGPEDKPLKTRETVYAVVR